MYYLLYFIPFAICWLLQKLFYENVLFLKDKWFWIIVFIAPAIFAFRVCFNFHHALLGNFFSGDRLTFWLSYSKWPVGFLLVFIPVYIIWKLKDSNSRPFYGFGPLKNVKPYYLMIIVMLPFLVIAAGRDDFYSMYPRAQTLEHLQLNPKFLFCFLYELFYSLDFFVIEIFFRGFLIIGLMNICGMQCITPAACFYCCIHFGKPMAEAISSFTGGLLLGIIIYHTKTIRGGLIVHLGIAWIMEISGFISHHF